METIIWISGYVVAVCGAVFAILLLLHLIERLAYRIARYYQCDKQIVEYFYNRNEFREWLRNRDAEQ